MAKKKPAFNMAEEIRKILSAKPTASNRDVFDALTAKYGKNSFNEASCGVAISNARKKLGVSKSKSVKKRRPKKKTSRRAGRPAGVTASPTVDLAALQAAKSLLATCDGNEAAAVAAIRQLRSLQLPG